MTAAETDLCRRLEDCRRNALGAIAMNSSAPTIRAQELEIQRLKAEVAELVAVLTIIANRQGIRALHVVAREAIAKHGA